MAHELHQSNYYIQPFFYRFSTRLPRERMFVKSTRRRWKRIFWSVLRLAQPFHAGVTVVPLIVTWIVAFLTWRRTVRLRFTHQLEKFIGMFVVSQNAGFSNLSGPHLPTPFSQRSFSLWGIEGSFSLHQRTCFPLNGAQLLVWAESVLFLSSCCLAICTCFVDWIIPIKLSFIVFSYKDCCKLLIKQ